MLEEISLKKLTVKKHLLKMNNYRNKTKIIATIGPKVSDKNNLLRLYKAGMNIARLNGSHNNLNWHEKTIKTKKRYLPEVPIL